MTRHPKTKSPLCFECADKLHQRESERWCEEKGLFTVKQKMDFCRKIGSMPKPTTLEIWQRVLANPNCSAYAARIATEALEKFLPKREPGEDDEHKTAF
jgi:hypothetical protein